MAKQMTKEELRDEHLQLISRSAADILRNIVLFKRKKVGQELLQRNLLTDSTQIRQGVLIIADSGLLEE